MLAKIIIAHILLYVKFLILWIFGKVTKSRQFAGNIWKLDIAITDRYDFTDFKEINEYLDKSLIKGVLGSTANNLAMISVASGVMHEYNVTIKFSINRGCDENE